MLKKVLIANRGEIALRVIRACRELGLETVAVYSDADRESLHVRFADDDVCIGPPPARDSYLNIPRIIAAAEITGADAIHPGYGFLAENAEFAEICAASKITFIGPTAEQIRTMGDKAQARKTMSAVGVPIVPGTPGPVEDSDEALAFAMKIGFPVIIKAAAGGGGKGMRVAKDPDDFGRSFQLARSEALSAFGNGDVYVEKYLTHPRHIEFQILGDSHGNILHLGERDCSVQRRHQKLIEESPSPAVDEALRATMGEAAVAGAKAIDYVGAGTIEMLLDEDGSYYFMEMNTRIQVEHPVTEMLYGVDLVKEQIRVAAGERLRIVTDHPPGGPGVRLDSHVYVGYTVPPYYDSLLAKLICQGRDRSEAIARMVVALESFIIEGVTTTIPFLARVMQNDRFISGDIDTKFLERESQLLKEPA
jgi:acetyl-CoA carboxylase biotin carboxylase subunit